MNKNRTTGRSGVRYRAGGKGSGVISPGKMATGLEKPSCWSYVNKISLINTKSEVTLYD